MYSDIEHPDVRDHVGIHEQYRDAGSELHRRGAESQRGELRPHLRFRHSGVSRQAEAVRHAAHTWKVSIYTLY